MAEDYNLNTNTDTNPVVLSPDEDIFTFSNIKSRLTTLISDFTSEKHKTATGRTDRYKELNTKQLRQRKEIPQYAHMVPVRAIDMNIRRQQPAYVNYLSQSRRLVIFKSIINPSTVTTLLEDEFTRGMTYSGWNIPFFKCIDGAQAHGWDAIEVVLDLTKPLHVGLEHIGHDSLIFSLDSHDIQHNEIILREIYVTASLLKRYVKEFNFSSIEVDKLTEKQKSARIQEKNIKIYKKFCKYDGVVYVSWFSLECDNWLLAPTKLFLGRRKLVDVQKSVTINVPSIDPISGLQTVTPQIIKQPVPEWQDVEETEYPIFILPYGESEQKKIADHKGRVFLDRPKQEARTANLSQFLSGCQLASSAIPIIEKEAAGSISAQQLETINVGDGKAIPFAIKFNSFPYPDSVMLSLQNYLDTFDAQEAGQINFAANNRQDTRKTATEIVAAKEESQLLSTVELTLFSTFLRNVYTYTWEIVRSRAIQNKVTLLFNQELGENNIEFIDQAFDIRAAGDIDVVKRQEMLGQYKDFWPVVQNTPVSMHFLAKMLIIAFPEDGNYFADLLLKGDPRILVQQLIEVLKNSIDTEELNSLTPENRDILLQLIQQGESMMTDINQSGNQPPNTKSMLNNPDVNKQTNSTINSNISPSIGQPSNQYV